MKEAFDVVKVAEVARVALAPEEAQVLQQQISDTLAYCEMLAEPALDDITPTLHGCAGVVVPRADVVNVAVARERLLADAPALHGAEYRLPKIVEDA